MSMTENVRSRRQLPALSLLSLTGENPTSQRKDPVGDGDGDVDVDGDGGGSGGGGAPDNGKGSTRSRCRLGTGLPESLRRTVALRDAVQLHLDKGNYPLILSEDEFLSEVALFQNDVDECGKELQKLYTDSMARDRITTQACKVYHWFAIKESRKERFTNEEFANKSVVDAVLFQLLVQK